MKRSIFVAFFVLTLATPALAHTGHNLSGGFAAGFLHPLFGLDHVAAMLAVGLWGALLGAPAIWMLPIVFPLVMAVGGALGILGIPLPGIELAIALSAVVLGLMVALAAKPHLGVAAMLVAVFAIFHGYAHGAELPAGANAAAYSLGFVIATGLLHLTGIGIGFLTHRPAGRLTVRTAGSAIAIAGLVFLGRLL